METSFLGKSTGKGGLGLWMHNLKSTTVIAHFQSGGYSGPAIKLGAGVTGYEAMEAAHTAGYRIVTGDCPTVGIAGGYTQGGGHSPLNGAYGMAADQVLEWEVVTANGEHLTASPSSNAELYWALSGGGAGTFAVVLSMSVKMYPEGPVGAASLSFSRAALDNEKYVEAVESWWGALPDIVDTGATTIWVVSSDGFAFEGFTAVDKTAEEVTETLKPFTSRLDALEVPYNFSVEEKTSYYEHFNDTNGPLPYGNWPTSMLFNSKFISRSVTASNQSISKVAATMEDIVGDVSMGSWTIGCHAMNVANVSHPDNSVVSYWRDAIAICITISLWDWTIPRAEMLDRKTHLAEVIAPALDAVVPEMGAYLNEADSYVYPPGSIDWQRIFYGSNYPRLRTVKDDWDPHSVFYAHTAVGSEDWVIDSDGRLCKA
jgi:FAD/FMN-containing dehydrogenase